VEQWWNDNMERNSEETQSMAQSPPLMSHEYTIERGSVERIERIMD